MVGNLACDEVGAGRPGIPVFNRFREGGVGSHQLIQAGARFAVKAAHFVEGQQLSEAGRLARMVLQGSFFHRGTPLVASRCTQLSSQTQS